MDRLVVALHVPDFPRQMLLQGDPVRGVLAHAFGIANRRGANLLLLRQQGFGARAARPRRSGYSRAEGRAPKRALSLARVRDTSACADCNCDCAALNDLRSAAICALTAPGKLSRPAKRTTMMPTVNRTARIRNDDLLIRFACFEKCSLSLRNFED